MLSRKTYVCDHHSASVASKRILQEAGELWITVGNMWTFPVHKGRYDIAQSRQRPVNICEFAESVPRGSCFVQPLTASQIHLPQLSSINQVKNNDILKPSLHSQNS